MTKRIKWIDCAKLIAVIAVVVDHCNGYLYTKPLVATASYYSVSLFVLLAGISLWTAYERGRTISFIGQLKKILKIFVAYAVATLVGTCIIHKQFDLKTYLGYLISFNIQGPYYYLVFFIQLLMVAPILIKWCGFVNNNKYQGLLHLGTIGCLGWFAYVSINYTYILPVHGGGQFLGGGSYIILYYLGMVLASNDVFLQSVSRRLMIALLSLGFSIIWVLMMSQGRLPFDRWMSQYWGEGFNPPSVNLMIYSMFILFLCYSVFSLLSEYNRFAVLRKFLDICCFLGKNTLYIWLYHLYVKTFLVNRFPDLKEGGVLVRIVVLGVIVMFPAVLKQLIVEFLKLYDKYVYQIDYHERSMQ